MLTAEAHVATERASRYLSQLGRHTSGMGRVQGHLPRAHGAHAHGGGDTPPEVQHAQWSGTHGIIEFPWGRCTLKATPDALILRAEASDAERLQRLQDGITHRIETIGRRDGLTVAWQPAEVTAAEPGEAVPPSITPQGGRAADRPGLGTAVGVIAIGVVAVGMHLGLLGAMLAASRWLGWGINIVLVLVLLKVLFLGGHAVLGGFAIHRRKRRATSSSPAVAAESYKAEVDRTAATNIGATSPSRAGLLSSLRAKQEAFGWRRLTLSLVVLVVIGAAGWASQVVLGVALFRPNLLGALVSGTPFWVKVLGFVALVGAPLLHHALLALVGTVVGLGKWRGGAIFRSILRRSEQQEQADGSAHARIHPFTQTPRIHEE